MKLQVRRVPNRKGANNPNWKGGVRRLGPYYYVYSPGHHRSIKYGQTPYTARSVIQLEKKIGRPLKKGELAHHIDSNKTNDSKRNLRLELKADHNRIHSTGKSNKERMRIKRITDKLPDKG